MFRSFLSRELSLPLQFGRPSDFERKIPNLAFCWQGSKSGTDEAHRGFRTM